MNVSKVFSVVKTVCIFSVSMCILCGLLYPLAVTGLSQLLFPKQANGSILYISGADGEKTAVGSSLIGQDFTDARFMKGRPSAVLYNTYSTSDVESGVYSGIRTGSQNLAASNPALIERVEADVEKLLEAHPSITKGSIPADLLTASGSGLDPHISPEAAEIQIPALSASTGLSPDALALMIENNTQGKVLGVFGEKTVNVLGVNLEIAESLNLIGE